MRPALGCVLVLLGASCGGEPESSAQEEAAREPSAEARVVDDVKRYVDAHVVALAEATEALEFGFLLANFVFQFGDFTDERDLFLRDVCTCGAQFFDRLVEVGLGLLLGLTEGLRLYAAEWQCECRSGEREERFCFSLHGNAKVRL